MNEWKQKKKKKKRRRGGKKDGSWSASINKRVDHSFVDEILLHC